ncbi:MAG: hypothetical protein HQ554_06300 [FCB group bacterium]|nr:hypothetical protein [FCB group bacterium]
MIKRKLVVVVIFTICFVNIAFAGPFGLEMGMTLKDLSENTESLGNGIYKITNVPKPHSAFEIYAVKIAPNGGLCWIKAIGKNIPTSSYGTELESKFMDMVSKLEKAYGNYKLYDYLLPGSIWDELNDWMMALIKKERILVASWSEEDQSNLSDNISNIIIATKASSSDSGFIVLEYSFTNLEACEKEIDAAEDGNL